MSVSAMNHFTILTDDVERTVKFYRDTLGLESGERPNLAFPGAWLYAAGAAILHVVGGRTRVDLVPGVIDHMAFTAHDLLSGERYTWHIGQNFVRLAPGWRMAHLLTVEL